MKLPVLYDPKILQLYRAFYYFQQLTKTENVLIFYGMSEVGCVVHHEYPPANGSCGRPIGCVEVKVSI